MAFTECRPNKREEEAERLKMRNECHLCNTTSGARIFHVDRKDLSPSPPLSLLKTMKTENGQF